MALISISGVYSSKRGGEAERSRQNGEEWHRRGRWRGSTRTARCSSCPSIPSPPARRWSSSASPAPAESAGAGELSFSSSNAFNICSYFLDLFLYLRFKKSGDKSTGGNHVGTLNPDFISSKVDHDRMYRFSDFFLYLIVRLILSLHDLI